MTNIPVKILTVENGHPYTSLQALTFKALEEAKTEQVPTKENRLNLTAMNVGNIRPHILTVTMCEGCKGRLRDMLAEGAELFESVRDTLPGVNELFPTLPVVHCGTFNETHAVLLTWQEPGRYTDPRYETVAMAAMATLREVLQQVWHNMAIAAALEAVANELEKAAEAETRRN